MVSHYDVLGVEPTADVGDIRHAWRVKIRLLHPDLHRGSPPDVRVMVGGQASNSVSYSYQPVASKCDAAKYKAAGSYAACLENAESKGATKGIDPSAATIAKCDDKFLTSCTKTESKSSDCSETGTCAATQTKIKYKGWDGLIYK